MTKDFESFFKNEKVWQRQANDLFSAAEQLHVGRHGSTDGNAPDPHTHLRGYIKGTLLLLSAAVENALKAARIKQLKSKELFKKGKPNWDVLGNSWKHHDLLGLSSQIGLAISNEERALLEMMSRMARWAGRFQAPLFPDEFQEVRNTARSVTYPDTLQLARQIIEKAVSL